MNGFRYRYLYLCAWTEVPVPGTGTVGKGQARGESRGSDEDFLRPVGCLNGDSERGQSHPHSSSKNTDGAQEVSLCLRASRAPAFGFYQVC